MDDSGHRQVHDLMMKLFHIVARSIKGHLNGHFLRSPFLPALLFLVASISHYLFAILLVIKSFAIFSFFPVPSSSS